MNNDFSLEWSYFSTNWHTRVYISNNIFIPKFGHHWCKIPYWLSLMPLKWWWSSISTHTHNKNRRVGVYKTEFLVLKQAWRPLMHLYLINKQNDSNTDTKQIKRWNKIKVVNCWINLIWERLVQRPVVPLAGMCPGSYLFRMEIIGDPIIHSVCSSGTDSSSEMTVYASGTSKKEILTSNTTAIE